MDVSIAQYFRSIKKYTMVSIMLATISILLGYSGAKFIIPDILQINDMLEESMRSIADLGMVTLFLLIFFRSTLNAYLILLLGTIAGIVPVMFIFTTGFIDGSLLYFVSNAEGSTHAVSLFVLQNGFDLPALVLLSAMSINLGMKFIVSRRKHKRFGPYFAYTLRIFWRTIMPLFFFISIIEAYIFYTK